MILGKNKGWKVFAYTIMIVFTFLTIAPLLWLLYSSFKPHVEIVRNIFSLPTSLHYQNYIDAWRIGNLGIYTINSIIYSYKKSTVSQF